MERRAFGRRNLLVFTLDDPSRSARPARETGCRSAGGGNRAARMRCRLRLVWDAAAPRNRSLGTVPPVARGRARTAFHALQIPHDVLRLGTVQNRTRRAQRDERADLQAPERPARHAHRTSAAPAPSRRTAAVLA